VGGASAIPPIRSDRWNVGSDPARSRFDACDRIDEVLEDDVFELEAIFRQHVAHGARGYRQPGFGLAGRESAIDPSFHTGHILLMDIDPEALARLCMRHDVDRLRLFGSAARGEDKPGSDVDLLVDFSVRKSLLDLVRIEREFSQFFGRPVDLLTERSLSPYLRDRILAETRVVYDRAA